MGSKCDKSVYKKWPNKPRAGLFDQRHQDHNDAKT